MVFLDITYLGMRYYHCQTDYCNICFMDMQGEKLPEVCLDKTWISFNFVILNSNIT